MLRTAVRRMAARGDALRRAPIQGFTMMPRPKVIGVPVGHETPAERICPSCRTFEREAGAELCPRCTLRAGIRSAKNDDKRRHLDSVRREVTALRLDRIDSDWPQKFLTTDEAARFHRDALAAMEAA